MDIELIEKLVQMLNSSDVSELSISNGTTSIRLRRGWGADDVEHSASLEADTDESENTGSDDGTSIVDVTAPMVGIFHPAQGLVIGSPVSAKQVLGFIESMKLMNEVAAPSAGTVTWVLAEKGSPVEFGQSLMKIREDV